MTMALCGIDVLEKHAYSLLHGQRIGLITNHTGLDREGRATADILHQANGVRLQALFSPEHGVRGKLDESVPDSRDEETGLPVYSLYGVRTRPTPEQLEGLDALVYDIQDIGTRFYTYISTLGMCLEEAAKHKIRFIVLDRPNPLGGVEIEGALADAASLSFTAYHPLPIRHGLTVGELARLFVAEKQLNVALDVVPVEGWARTDLWDATNLIWTNPSPNMRSLTEALFYPGIGLLETTNVSVGRGTDTPFEVVGAPWMEARTVAAELNARELPGVRFVPIRFMPHSSVHAGHRCGGVNIVITARHRFVPVYTGLAIAETLLRLYPTHWESRSFNNLLVNRQSYQAFLGGATAEALLRSWYKPLQSFRERRRASLLYS